MQIEYDPAKRALTLEHRSLDFAQAGLVFESLSVTVANDRLEYGEVRYQTIGRLGRKTVMVVWTPRGSVRRIISMRECNGRERKAYEDAVG